MFHDETKFPKNSTVVMYDNKSMVHVIMPKVVSAFLFGGRDRTEDLKEWIEETLADDPTAFSLFCREYYEQE
jgi:hypothetical protein